MDLVLAHVQLIPEYHTYVMNAVLFLLDMQHVLRITSGITLTHLIYVHLTVSITHIIMNICDMDVGCTHMYYISNIELVH